MGCAGRSLQAAKVSRVHLRLCDDTLSKSQRNGRSSGQTMNKSCDACSAKKRKCDGGDPCSRCVRRGDGHLCKYSRRRPYTSNNKRFRAWRSSTAQKVNATLKARTKPYRESSTDAHQIGRDKREMRCVEAPHQLSPDALSKPTPATKMRLSSSDYDAYARLVGARPEAFDLIASTSRSPEGARNPKPKITAECIETELKASAEKCIVPTFHGRDVESQIVTSWAFPVKEQSAIRANVGMDIENG
ncbi:unnamed protein product, partial [Ascophyllum nodosum]